MGIDVSADYFLPFCTSAVSFAVLYSFFVTIVEAVGDTKRWT